MSDFVKIKTSISASDIMDMRKIDTKLTVKELMEKFDCSEEEAKNLINSADKNNDNAVSSLEIYQAFKKFNKDGISDAKKAENLEALDTYMQMEFTEDLDKEVIKTEKEKKRLEDEQTKKAKNANLWSLGIGALFGFTSTAINGYYQNKQIESWNNTVGTMNNIWFQNLSRGTTYNFNSIVDFGGCNNLGLQNLSHYNIPSDFTPNTLIFPNTLFTSSVGGI